MKTKLLSLTAASFAAPARAWVLALLVVFATTLPIRAEYAIFDSTTDSIALANGPTPVTLGTTATIEAVFVPLVNTLGVIYLEQVDGLEHKSLAVTPSGVDGAALAPPSITTVLGSTTAVSLNTAHHLAFVRDGAEERLYLDGVLVSSRPVTNADISDALNSAVPASLGAGRHSGGGITYASLIGALDSVRISNTARYTGATITVPTGDMTTDANTLLLMNFDFADVTGNVVADLSGNGRHGTLGTTFPGTTSPTISATPTYPGTVWVSGRDLAANEQPDGPQELVNPNPTVPEWSYGTRSTSASTAFTPYTTAQHANDVSGYANLDGWNNIYVNTGTTPIIINFGAGPLHPLQPGAIYTHSQDTDFPVVRWTAPAAGTYLVSASWLDLDFYGGGGSDGATGHVVVNGTQIFVGDFNNNGNTAMSRLISLEAGATVDFTIGRKSLNWNDATAFNASITHAPTVTHHTSTYVGGTRNWADPASWSTPTLFPSAFPQNGSPVANFTYDAVQSSGTLTVNEAIAVQKFTMTGGTLTGSSPLTVNDTLTLTGILSSATNVTALGNVVFNGGSRELNGGTVLNLGDGNGPDAGSTTDWTSGNILMRSPSTLNNRSDSVINASANNSLFGNSSGTGYIFNNEGIFNQNAGTTTIGNTDTSFTFNNSGLIQVNGGILRTNTSCTSNLSGSHVVASGAALELRGTANISAGTTFTGAGTVKFARDEVVTGAITVDAALEIFGGANYSGSLSGAGSVTANGPLQMGSTESLARPGTLTGGVTLTATGPVTLIATEINGAVLNIGDGSGPDAGAAATWSAGNMEFRSSGNNVVLNIRNDSELNVTNNGDLIMNNYQGTATINNEGVFTKSGGGGATRFGAIAPYPVYFNNSGTVNANNGSLAFNHGYTQTAGALVLNGGGVSSGTFAIRGGKLQGNGTVTGAVSSASGTIIIEPGIGSTTGLLNITGDLTLTSGSKLSFDLGGTTPGTGYDQLTENGGALLNLADSTLEVRLLGGFFPASADTFAVVDSNQNLAASTLRRADGSAITNGSRITLADNKGSCQVNYTADKVILSAFLSTITSVTLDDNQIVENAPDNAVVGLLGAIDTNPAATFTYSLVAGTGDTGNGQFQIGGVSGNELQVKAGMPDLNFEAQPSYSIRVRVTNNTGVSLEQIFTIQVQDVPSPSDIALSASSITEGQDPNTVVGTLSATDPAPGATFSFELVSGIGSTDNSRFNLFGTGGSSLRSSQKFDKEAPVVADRGPFSIRVKVTSSTGEFFEKALSITVTDIPNPTDIALSSSSITEGQPVNTVIGTLSATDAAPGATFSFALVSGTGSTDNSRFNLFGTGGSSLRSSQKFDKEAPVVADRGPFSIRVRVTSSTGETFEKALPITVIDIPNPTDIALSASTIEENQDPDTVIGTLSATDPNADTTHAFKLVSGSGSGHNNRFNISGTSLRSSEKFDFETSPGPFSIRVRTTNAEGESFERVFSISLIDLIAPTDITLSASTLTENQPVDTVVGTLSATDANVGTTHTFALAGVPDDTDRDNFRFHIHTDSGVTSLRTRQGFDFEDTPGPFSVRVRVTNSLKETFDKVFAITLTNTPNPTDIDLSVSSIAENQDANTVVGILSALDPDPETALTFALVDTVLFPDNARFNLLSASGVTSLRSSQAFDKEALVVADRGPFSIRLRVTNGLNESYDETFPITVTDQGPGSIVVTPAFLLEAKPAGTTVGSFSSTVEPAGSTVTYALAPGTVGTHNDDFVITGGLLKTTAVFDHDTTPTRSIRVRATGPGTETFEQTLTITVNEAGPPTDITLSAIAIAENQPANTVVGTLTTADPDPEAALTFTFVDTASFPDNARFNVLSASGVTSLRSSQAFDKEAPLVADRGPFSIRLRVTNGASEFYEETFSITVTDQGPTALALTPSSLREGRPSGTTVGALSATAVVPAGTAISTWELVAGGADNGLFTLDGANLKTAAVLQREDAATRSIRVRATDANGESFEQDLTVSVTDVSITDITLSSTSVLENLPAGAVVANLGAVFDPADTVATPAFSIVSATPNDALAVSGTQIITTRPIRRSVTPSIALRLRAEATGASFEENATVTVNANSAVVVPRNQDGTPFNSNSSQFGEVIVGGTPSSVTNTFLVKNSGPGHAFNVRFSLSPSNNVFAAVSTDLAADDDLAPGESATVSITFTPQSYGSQTVTMALATDSGPSTNFFFTGRAVGAEISVQHPLGTELVDGTALDFGSQPFGLSGQARTFIVKNVGFEVAPNLRPLTPVAASITGPDAAFFVLDTQGFGPSVAVGATSSFRVNFQPDDLRSYNATLTITSNDLDDASFDIPLTGEGVTPLMIAQTAYAKASDTNFGDYFGTSIAISGDTVIVGAPEEDGPADAQASSSGSVYVFVRDADTGAWSQQAKLRASNPDAENRFGSSVAISGDTLVVGASGEASSTTGIDSTPDKNALNAGAAYVFVRSGTNWTQQAYLKAHQVNAGDSFGSSVEVSGDTVVVGASAEDSSTTGINSTPNEAALFAGAAYVFVRNNGATWTQQAYLKAHQVNGFDFFGVSVSVSGDTVVVGAALEASSTTGINSTPNEGAASAGAAYVFVRSGTNWTQQAYLKAHQVNLGDYFGSSVAVSGDTVVVGASAEASSTTGVNSTPDELAAGAGAAYVFVRSGTNWTQQAYLKAHQVNAGDKFGGSVAVNGDTVVVGAFAEDSSTTGINSTPDELAAGAGAAYVFTRGGTNWNQQAYLKANQVTTADQFGVKVAVSGDTMVAGAQHEDSSTTGINSTPNEALGFGNGVGSGAAYIFEVVPPEVRVHDGPSTGSPKLADGQAQAVDYGPTPLGVSVTRSFTINNVRALPLTVSSITAPGYEVVSAPSTIPAQGTATFSVRLEALTLGTNSSLVTINTNDGPNPEFIFPITAEVLTLAPGSFDPRFGTNGVVKIDFGANDKAFDMLMLPDGGLVLGGEREDAGVSQFALARLQKNGTLDTSFGGSGKVTHTVPGLSNPSITGVCLQDGNLVAVGTRLQNNLWFGAPSQPSFALARYLPDGSLDSTFGTAGCDVDNVLTEGDFTWNIAVNPSGKLLVAGMTSAQRAYVRRFNKNGGRDISFGTSGTTLLSNGQFGGALTVNAAGEIFAAGGASGTFRARIWRLRDAGTEISGAVLTFPKVAPVGYPLDTNTADEESATAVILQADGKPVIAANRGGSFDRNRGHGFITGRATTSFAADTTFNGTGVALEDIDPAVHREQANSVVVQADGKLVVVGQVGGKFVVVRYTTTGELDPSFDGDGKKEIDLGGDASAYKVVLDAAGDIYVAGHASNGTNQDFVVVKLIGSITHEPAIVVRNGGSATAPVIINGQATAIGYGTPRVGSSGVIKSFLINNVGTGPLNINSITVPDPDRFQITSTFTTVAAGTSAALNIRLNADATGTFGGPVTISTNDPAQGIFTFPITGSVVVNTPPSFNGFSVSTVQGIPATIDFAKILANVSDANGDSLSVSGLPSSTSASGSALTLTDKATIIYTPPVGLVGVDSFRVSITDGIDVIQGTILVTVTLDPVLNPKNPPQVSVNPISGAITLIFAGQPGNTYTIQSSSNLVTWELAATVKADKQGVITFTDEDPPKPSAFYRIKL